MTDRRTLAHDAAAPLMLISGFADLLSREGVVEEAERRDYAQRILRAAEELRALLDEVASPSEGET